MANIAFEILSNHIRNLDRSGASFNQRLELSEDAFEELKFLIKQNDEDSKKLEEHTKGEYRATLHSPLLENSEPILLFGEYQFKIKIK